MAKPLKPKVIELEQPKRKFGPATAPTTERSPKEKPQSSNVLHRMTSALWVDENVPHSLYEVTMKTPQVIDVLVISGKNITKGWFPDIDSSPDPFIMMRIPNTPNGIKRTKPCPNPSNPVWNEHFLFFVDTHASNRLEITLTDSSYIRDRNMGVVKINLDKLEVNDAPLAREMTFLNGAKVYVRVWRREASDPPELRNGQSLSEEEVCFLEKRRAHVMDGLNRLLARGVLEDTFKNPSEIESLSSKTSRSSAQKSSQGSGEPEQVQLGDKPKLPKDNVGPGILQETPIIAVLGSGGGYRALVGFAGAMEGLQRSGVLDCATYVAGISGSAWYLSFLYSQHQHARRGPVAFEGMLRDRVTSSWGHFLMPRALYRFITIMSQKAASGQPIAFTDFFGALIANKLLGEETAKKTLSSQRNGLEYGLAPLPLYTCIHINRDIAPSVFQEWVDFSPYDVWISKYALSMPTELFGCKWFCGVVIRKFPEAPMSFLMGLWGSIFSVLYKRIVWICGKKNVVKETAGPEKMAIGELATYRAYKEGYPPNNNETGTSDITLEARTSDEVSTPEEDPEERKRIAKDLEKAEEEMALAKNKAAANRFSRQSKRGGSGLKTSSSAITEPRANIQKDRPSAEMDAEQKLEAVKHRLKSRRFRKFLLDQTEKKEKVQRNFWRRMLDSLMSEGVWDTRAGRAGLIFNPLRGLVLKPGFSRDVVETTVSPRDTEPMKGTFVMSDPRAKRWFMVDPGLAMNLPFPPLLRPQRAVDVFIVFDFSTRFSDEASPFDHLLLTEHWARVRRVRFPPVAQVVQQYLLQPPRECYVFEDKTDQLCPTVIYFPLINNLFRKFRLPGVPRVSITDKRFGEFSIFSDPHDTYAITNFCYNHMAYDRLKNLMVFNVEQNAPALRAVLEQAVQRKRSLLPAASQELERLKREEEEEAARLERKKKLAARRRRRLAKKAKMREARRLFISERPSMLRKRIEAQVEARQKRLEEAMRSDRGNPALARALRFAAVQAEHHDSKALITQLLWVAYDSARQAVVRTRKRLGLEHPSMVPAAPSIYIKKFHGDEKKKFKMILPSTKPGSVPGPLATSGADAVASIEIKPKKSMIGARKSRVSRLSSKLGRSSGEGKRTKEGSRASPPESARSSHPTHEVRGHSVATRGEEGERDSTAGRASKTRKSRASNAARGSRPSRVSRMSKGTTATSGRASRSSGASTRISREGESEVRGKSTSERGGESEVRGKSTSEKEGESEVRGKSTSEKEGESEVRGKSTSESAGKPSNPRRISNGSQPAPESNSA